MDLEAFFHEYKEKKNAYQMALSTMYYDQATIAPKNGIPYRNRMTAILSGEAFDQMADKKSIQRIEELARQENVSAERKKELQLLLRELNELRVLPREVYVEYRRTIADSEAAWHEAKEQDDYQLFKPHLISVIEKQKEILSYVTDKKSDYDFMLDSYQINTDIAYYDRFFDAIRKELLPFLQKLLKEGTPIDDSLLFTAFDIKEQEAFMQELMDYMKVNDRECYMTTTEHPFTDFFSAHEARITTHYHEHNVMSAIFSTIHEYGHAQYGLQVKEAYEGTSLFSGIGTAMHESQSRFMENHIGRNRAFWEVNYPKLQQHFPKQLQDVSLDDFMRMINVSRPSFIRTEADELTYPIHILIRYELEKEIFNSTADYDNLDTMWNDKYEEYLGIRPEHDRDGILQDMHWGGALLGYFPTYALGSAFAAQFYHQMEQDMDVEEALRSGAFEKISGWLKENIHQYGAFKDADELMMDVCGESFDPKYYIEYLKNKYAQLYQISAD